LLEGLRNIFEHLGTLPGRYGLIMPPPLSMPYKGFKRFMLHYNFISNFCNPNSSHEKGNVENKVGYTRRNYLVPIRSLMIFGNLTGSC